MLDVPGDGTGRLPSYLWSFGSYDPWEEEEEEEEEDRTP